MDQYDQARLCRKIHDGVQGRIGKAGPFSGDLGGNKFFMDAELPDTRKNTRKSQEYSADVGFGVHVRRVEPGDHGIKALLFI